MGGIAKLRKIQIGKETTKGTPVAATAILLGELDMKESPTIHRPAEERGSLAEFHRSLKVGNLAELSYEGDLTFEQILYLLHMGVQGGITPTGPGVDGEYTWTFTPNLTSAGTFDSFTIEYGDNVQAWETEYCLARQIEISGAINEVFRVRADIFGRKMTATSFTAGLSAPSVESLPFQKAKLYIDDETGVIGTTEKASTLIAATLRINTGLAPVRYGDGSLDFSGYIEQAKSAELRMTFAFNSGAETERTKFDGQTLRLVRIEAEGSIIGGTTRKKLTLDFCGIYTDFSTLDERDGEDIVEVVMSSQPGTNYTKPFEITVVNAVASLP